MRVVVEEHDEVGAGAGLDGGGDARLKVVAVDRLEIDLDPEGLLRLRQDLAAKELVGGGDEIVPAQPMNGRRLRVGRRPAGGQDRGEAAGVRGKRRIVSEAYDE
jgi:hypothetical protein